MRSVVERIPPHNEDAEKAVLGASMMDKNAFEEFFVEVLKEENKYLYDAVYSDKELKTKFDFTKPITKNNLMSAPPRVSFLNILLLKSIIKNKIPKLIIP